MYKLVVINLSSKIKTFVIDGQKIALELGNAKVLNSVVLGFAAKFIGFDKTDWLEMIEKTVPQKTIEINKKAFEVGFEK